MTYQRSITYLYGLQKYGIKFGLAKIYKLLAVLNNPQENLPCIHIAGTNGKGSTAAFIASILSKAGYKVGLYTSPHLISFTERIKINSKKISKRDVARLTTLIKNKTKIINNITYFEFVTAMALCYFAEQNVEISLLEVGMGGRLDATNVVSPLISIITNISKEHENYLGHTLLEIAHEKTGIIKKKSILITGATQPKVLSLFKERCHSLHTRCYQLGKDIFLNTNDHNIVTYRGIKCKLQGLKIGLLGDYQLNNAAMALAAVEMLRTKGYQIRDKSIYQGLSEVSWPGRLEVVKNSPLVVLDGAHNPAAMKNLKKALFNTFKFRELILILGIMEDKNIRGMIKEILPFADKVIFCRPKMDRAASTRTLSNTINGLKITYYQIEDVKEATNYALSIAHSCDLICVTGSLFTVGEARKIFLNA